MDIFGAEHAGPEGRADEEVQRAAAAHQTFRRERGQELLQARNQR